MDSKILAARQFLSNDIESLAQIIETNLEYLVQQRPPQTQAYLTEIKTLIGFGFTAALTAGEDFCTEYRKHLGGFFLYCTLPITETLTAFSKLTATMINVAQNAFASLSYPTYYQNFSDCLKKILDTAISDMAGKSEEVNRLQQIITLTK